VKRRIGIGVALGFLASIALAGPTSAAFTGLVNGSFETGPYADNGSGFQQLDAPNTSIDGWSVGAGSVDWIGTYWPAPDGAMSIDMSGADAGTLSQTFETTIGNTYTVSFLLSGNPAGLPSLKTLEVNATGGTVGLYTHDTTGTDLTTMVWAPQTYTFLATSATTTLSFVSTTAGAFGPAIDGVDVSEDVAEKDDCKNGGWESMLDTAGNGFKNQGDCVSFFATKGKNPGALAPAAPADASAATDADSAKSQVKQSKKSDKATAKGESQKAAKDKTKTKTKGNAAPKAGSKSKKGK
jgi:choice-of-anchor C domain-containing protein